MDRVKGKGKDTKRLINSLKSQYNEDLEMYKDLLKRSDKKRQDLIHEIKNVLKVIDKEKDANAYNKA